MKKTLLNLPICLLMGGFLALPTIHAEGTITTVVGNGIPGFNEDWHSPNDLQLNKPSQVALDSQGNLYIADTFNHRVRGLIKNTYNPTYFEVRTIAGSNNAPGYGGDGGAANQARLNNPWGIAVDNKGNLYIADTDNHRVRKVVNPIKADATNGTIVAVAGNGTGGNTGDGGVATNAQLNHPTGVAVDSAGNLYIADSDNHVIRKVDITGMITRIAGTGVAGFSGDGSRAIEAQLNYPKRVAVSRTGIIYIVDKGNDRIRRVDTNGIITTVVGNGRGYGGDNGPATAALLNSPSDISIDARGNLFIADTLNHRIRKVDAATHSITTIAGSLPGYGGDNGPASSAQLNMPDGVTVSSSGSLYIADTDNHRIRRVDNASAVSDSGGVAVTDNLWIKAVIQTDNRGPIEAVWKLGGDSKTQNQDRVIWGYFYASPNDVDWGVAENPDLFVKIWYDHRGWVDVNFFHVSVPDIEVYSAMAEIKKEAAYNRSTMQKRYVRHTYKPQEGVYESEVVDTVENPIISVINNPVRSPMPFYDLGLGTLIQSIEKGAINGAWRLGGSGRTPRGDEVAWGFFYANPIDVNWGLSDNPDVYVKMWADVITGRIDVNFFHVSAPVIEVYSGHASYEKQGVTTTQQRYTRHEYHK
jgi:sugar lactone lactonase YvrE